jgi:hypothetical protein
MDKEMEGRLLEVGWALDLYAVVIGSDGERSELHGVTGVSWRHTAGLPSHALLQMLDRTERVLPLADLQSVEVVQAIRRLSEGEERT